MTKTEGQIIDSLLFLHTYTRENYNILYENRQLKEDIIMKKNLTIIRNLIVGVIVISMFGFFTLEMSGDPNTGYFISAITSYAVMAILTHIINNMSDKEEEA